MYCFLSGGYGYGGGAQTTQLMLLKSLNKIGEGCKLFDVKGGSVHKAFLESKLPFEFIELDRVISKKDYSKHLTKDDLLIVFDVNFFGNLMYFGNSNCKILVWEIFYPWVERFIYTRYFPIKLWAQRQELSILNILVKYESFFFIDYMGKEITEKRLNTSISDYFYLPIPMEIPVLKKKLAKKNYSKLTVTYVGRSVDWKINPFIKIINDFEKTMPLSQVEFIVVCNNALFFKSSLKKALPFYNQVSIRFYENINYEQRDNILMESDIHFGMGVAALDGAKLGLPTILIDFSYDEFPPNYKYRWLYETDKLILGKEIKKNTQFFDGKHSLTEILTMIKSNKDVISMKCYEYVLNNYDTEKVTNKIVGYKKSATLTFQPFHSMFTTKYFTLLRKLGVK